MFSSYSVGAIQPDFDNYTRRALLCEGEPDRVPQAELWIDNSHMSKFLGREVKTWFLDAKAIVEFWAKCGYDYVRVVPYYVFPKNGPSHMDLVCGKADHIEVAEGAGIITDNQTFERYTWPRYEDIDFSPVENTFSYLQDGFKIISGTFAGVFEETSQLMGLETLSLLLYENPELVRSVTNKVGSLFEGLIQTLAQMPDIGAIWHSDDIAYKSSTMFSPDFFREYIFPWYKRYGDICREYRKPFIFHSDGNLLGVLEDLIACGVNAIHPIEPLGMDIVELKQKYAGRLCLIGNIALENELTRGTPEDVRRAVEKRIHQIAPGGGYCCGSSNSVTDYVPFENFLAMIKAIQDYGQYQCIP